MAERLRALEARHTDAPTLPLQVCETCNHPMAECTCPPPTDAEAIATLEAAFPDGTWADEGAVPPNS